jgi:hypothetical protein
MLLHCLKLGWREVAQGRVNPLVLIDLVQEATEVLVGPVKVGIIMKRDFLFIDGAHETLGRSILRRLADGRHADLDEAWS